MSNGPTVSNSIPQPGHGSLAVLIVAALIVATCGPGTADLSPTESPAAATASTGTATPTPSPSAAAPSWTSDIAGQLECDGPVPLFGGEVGELFPGKGAGGATAEAALTAFLGPSNPFASLPTGGYTSLHTDEHWASFAHVYGGSKAIVVLTDEAEFDGTEFGPGWAVVGLRACDASEFDPAVPLTFPITIWKDADGDPVSTVLVHSKPGPGHCGWESVTFLSVGDALFFRDPEGVMADYIDSPFEVGATVPLTSTDTGYRSNGYELWVDPGGDAYLVATQANAMPTERWPRGPEDFGCA